MLRYEVSVKEAESNAGEGRRIKPLSRVRFLSTAEAEVAPFLPNQASRTNYGSWN
jgi:hypothetical protein